MTPWSAGRVGAGAVVDDRQDHRLASIPGRVCVCAPIHPVADGSAHRIPCPPIRIARTCGCVGLACSSGGGDRRRPGPLRGADRRAARVQGAGRRRRPGQGRDRAGHRGVAAGPQQRRLVSAAGLVCDHRHPDRRRRRRLSPGRFQRPTRAGAQGHHVGGRAAPDQVPSDRGVETQGSQRRTTARTSGRSGLRRGRPGGDAPPTRRCARRSPRCFAASTNWARRGRC